MSAAARDEEYRSVSRALRRRVVLHSAPVRVVAEPIGLPLAHLLDACAFGLTLAPSYALAEMILEDVERTTPIARLVILAGDEWTTRILSAAGARPWPRVFEPLRGLGTGARPSFIRRACTTARNGHAVCGIEPWRQR